MSEAPAFNKFKRGQRTAIRLSEEELVRTGSLPGGPPFPLVLEPAMPSLNPISWAESHRESIGRQLLEHGAVLLRGFDVPTPERFRELARAVTPDLLDYTERAAPRTEVESKVYTSTEFPADEVIPFHHEMSYSHNWPTKLFFFCDVPAQSGGATPLVDDREIFGRIPDDLKRRFADKKVMYVRNYGEGVDLSWQEAFQTDRREDVEDYCRRYHTEFEWRDGERLRTRQVRQALATHPVTGDTVWFNHAHMFHQSNLKPEVRRALLEEFAPDELPRNAFYGDGEPIPDEVLDTIRGIYSSAARAFTWQRGDVLVVDNFLMSHGRESFVGPRRILVAMAELYDSQAAA